MATERPPEVVREKISRLGTGRVSCALIYEREFSREEIARFYTVSGESSPAVTDFEVMGRIIRYDCPEAEEAKWRLAVEIFLVKAFRDGPKRRPLDSDLRRRLGLHSLYR